VFALALVLLGLTALTAVVVQVLRGQTPVEISAYLMIYSIVLLPGIVFMTSVSIALNVFLRDKYLVYAFSIGAGAGLFYLYSHGHNHWLYNPLLYQLWKYDDLTTAGNSLTRILRQRFYWIAIAAGCLALAHLFFERRSERSLAVDSRLSGAAWSALVTLVSMAAAAWAVFV